MALVTSVVLPKLPMKEHDDHGASQGHQVLTKRNEAGFTATHSKPFEPGPIEDKDERSIFDIVAIGVGKLVTRKDKAYGSAVKKGAPFLRMLFPNGIHPDRYEDLLLIIRIYDKLMRLATRKDAFGESPYHDIAGYGVLGVEKDSQWEGKGPEPKKEEQPCVGEKV